MGKSRRSTLLRLFYFLMQGGVVYIKERREDIIFRVIIMCESEGEECCEEEKGSVAPFTFSWESDSCWFSLWLHLTV